VSDLLDAARGRWPDLLAPHLAELAASGIAPDVAAVNVASFGPGTDRHWELERAELVRFKRLSIQTESTTASGHPQTQAGFLADRLIRLDSLYRHLEEGGWRTLSDSLPGVPVPVFDQWKPNRPRAQGFGKAEKAIKYEAPPGFPDGGGLLLPRVPERCWRLICERHGIPLPDAATVAGGFWPWAVTTPDMPLLIAEGWKKALAALSAGHAAVALPGVQMGRRVAPDGSERLIPGLEALAKDRPLLVVFDAEAKQATANKVGAAAGALARCLRAAGGKPSIARLPLLPGQPKTGLDDLWVASGPEALDRALADVGPQRPVPLGQPNTASLPPPPEQQPYAPSFAKPTQLEAGELLAMLRNQAQGGRMRYNTFSQQLEIDGTILEGAERFYLLLAEQGFKVKKELALDCLIKVARENPYDPVALYLEHVAATVEPAYIGGLATAYLRPEDSTAAEPSLYDHMLRCTLIGAVRRVFEPGCKHDTATILMGDQGARKSSFWSALGGAFFSDALGDISSKDDLMILHRSWLMEWAELDHIMGRRHAGQIKSFLSQSTDIFRVPYGRATEAFPRRGIIVGSTNQTHGFLIDQTGNRRFWVIPITRTEAQPIDTPTLMAERDAIWSAAVHAYRAGDPNFLPPHLAQQVTAENEGYQVDNPWLPAVAQWVSQRIPGESITSERILVEAIQKPIERQTKADQMAIADLLRALGFERKRSMVGGQRAWRWLRAE
jgi:hypothetical protein